MIVFGWNSFNLKTYQPSSLGLPAELDQQMTFERRQKYFHLFWIPFFGIGKIWVIRKRGDHKQYEVPNDLLMLLEAMPFEHKTPWYTFALPLLGAAGFVLFLFLSSIAEYNSKQQAEAYRTKRNADMTQSINAPLPVTYFKMENGDKNVFLKVLGYENQSLLCLISNKNQERYSENEMLEAFITDSVYQSFDTVKVRKEDMLKTINQTDEYSFEGYEVLNGAGKFELEEMKVINFPVFKNLGSEYRDGQFVAIVQNIGEAAKFKSYQKETSNLEFETPFPDELKSGDAMFIKASYYEAEPRMRGKLKFELSTRDSVEYEFSIYGTYLTIKPVK